MQQDAVVLEGERTLRSGAAQRPNSPRKLRLAIGIDEAPDPLELLVRDIGIPAANEVRQIRGWGRLFQVDALEQTVHRVPDLGCR